MLPTAPRRGCLAPSGRGLWRGAGRRVASLAPGWGKSEPVQRAAPCETAAYSLVCGLGRAVSASQSRGLGIVVASIFGAKTSVIPRRHLPGFCVGVLALTACLPLHLGGVLIDIRARTQHHTHWCVTALGNILPTLRTILLNGNQFAASDIRSSKTASSVLQQALGRATRRTAAHSA